MASTRRGALGWLASVSALALLPSAVRAAARSPLYKDVRAPIADRVRDLLGRMTLEEKVAQMIALWARKAEVMDGLTFDPAKAASAYPGGVGAIARPSDKRGGPGAADAAGGTAANWRTPADTVAFVNAVQHWATTGTRLGIPVLFHEESLHGYMATEATMFPQAIALAGTFDRDLVRRAQAIVAREVRARGIAYVLSPVVDICRDPRWGRIEETFGEDPYLCAEIGVAAVEGLQGAGKPERLPPGKVYATLKHMTGHGQPQAGENVAPAPFGPRYLRENFLPPFRAVVARTAIGAVMPSYNEIDGIPSHANRWLLGDVLRGEWGFEGLISSDYGAIPDLAGLHHIAADLPGAARLALAAGVDSDLPDGEAYRTLADQVHAGLVEQAAIDAAVARILTIKFRAGLFENPFGDAALAARITGNDEARAIALDAARKAICLLVNRDETLPLAPRGTLAVIGPNADVALLGGYSSVPKQAITPLDGIRARVAGRARVVHAQGVRITTSDDRSADTVTLADPAENRRLIAEAVAVARDADAIVLAIGDTEQTSREGFAANHLGDRDSLALLAQQDELFDALADLGKPVVVLAIGGRPPSWPRVAERASAMLGCWYLGQEAGTAIAEALFGDINPGAKLPVSVVRDVGQVPYFYDHKPSAERGYLFASTDPLFPFGHGLSYTRFEVGAPVLSALRIARGEQVSVSVTVANRGARAGDEVVQLYLRHVQASVAQPVMALRGFERVSLAPGETRSLAFTLGPADFAIWNAAMVETVEPGSVEIMAGNSSAAVRSAMLEIV